MKDARVCSVCFKIDYPVNGEYPNHVHDQSFLDFKAKQASDMERFGVELEKEMWGKM